MNTRILQITQRKKQYLPLLLLADEQESMIDRYLERGEMFALYDGDLKAACVITDEGNGTYEIKNIATYPHYQRKGYGTRLIKFLLEHYKDRYQTMLVGTGDSTYTIPTPIGYPISSSRTTTIPCMRTENNCGTWFISKSARMDNKNLYINTRKIIWNLSH